MLDPAGPPPFRFQISYDDAAIQPRRRYVVRATVRQQGRLLFTTDQAYPVLTGGAAAPLNLLLVSAARRRDAHRSRTLDRHVRLHGRCADDQVVRRRQSVAGGDGGRLQGARVRVSERAPAAGRGAAGEPGRADRCRARPWRRADLRSRASWWSVSSASGPARPAATRVVDSPLRNTYWKLVRLSERRCGWPRTSVSPT